MKQEWEMIVFESPRGEKFVEKFIRSLKPAAIAKVAHALDLLQKHGPFLGMPRAKRLVKNIHELRIRGRQEVRVLYAFVGKKIYLLHAFMKKTQKTPQKEIVTARKRLQILT